MKTKTIRAAVAAALTIAASVLTANADGEKRPMALMVMFDGLRADGIESGSMPNVMSLRNGTWQAGYNGAWSVTAQIAPGSDSVSAPNHISIATGYSPARHGATANGQTANVDYTTYPTWLKRVIDAKSGATAAFAYSWGEDADLGPAAGVTFLGGTDAQNATDLAALLASANAPDATMFFINEPDAGGHAGNYYPYTTGYRNSLALSDGYLGQCLSAIASRPTFADEDWLILVTSDHGGYLKTHGESGSGTHGSTVPIVIAGTSVTAGRIPGISYNFDVCASALAHFGITVAGLEATARDGAAEMSRPISAGLAAYLPFDEDFGNKIANNVTSQTNVSPAITTGGRIGSYCDIPSGSYIRLQNSQYLTYEGGDKSYTAIVWVKMNQVSSGDPVILANKKWSAGGPLAGTLLCAGRNMLSYRGVTLNSGSGSTTRIDVGPYHVEGDTKWTFYAISRWDDGTHIIYQGRSDGTLHWLSTTFDTFVMRSANPFCIGQDGLGTYNSKFVGGVDDVAIWTRALRHEDIRLIYESGLAGTAIGDLITADPATAVWTGAGSDPSNSADPANWSCADSESNPLSGAIPGLATAVTISGATTFDLADGKKLSCGSVLFDNVTLSSDRDWSGIDITKIANGSSIDLCGKRLTFSGINGANDTARICTITNSVADVSNPAVLEIDVPSGMTFENKALIALGNIKFVKTGAGTYTSNSQSQTYTGDTYIEGGTARQMYAGGFGLTSSTIHVMTNGTFDIWSRSVSYTIEINGGSLVNTFGNPGSPSNANATLRNLVLKTDATFTFSDITQSHDITLAAGSTWDLGGHTFTLILKGKDPDFYVNSGVVVSNGNFIVNVLPSTLRGFFQNSGLIGENGLNLDLGNSCLRLKGHSTVVDLTVSSPNADVTSNSGCVMDIYGTFTPNSLYGFNMKMMDGSTVNLTGKTSAWSSIFTQNTSTLNCKVEFEAGGTVTVDLTGREAEMESLMKGEVEGNERGYVITWATKPTNVKFVPKMANAEKYKLSVTDNGLRILKPRGIVIVVK